MNNNTPLSGMSKTEYIIWRMDARMYIKDHHPGWDKKKIDAYIKKAEETLKNTGIDIINR